MEQALADLLRAQGLECFGIRLMALHRFLGGKQRSLSDYQYYAFGFRRLSIG